MTKKLLFILVCILIIIPTGQVFANQGNGPEVVSESVVLLDSRSNAILFAKNEHERMYPASLTKIATAIYAIEKGHLSDIVKVNSQALEVEGTSVYLNEGEEVSLEKLIQGMLINSGNDAAAAIALHLDGSMEKFSTNINNFLRKKIGVTNTHFTNPHGLFSEDHYTTAYDLGLITNYALRNETFKEIFGTRELPWDGQSWDTTLFTHHLLLKGEIPFEGVTGGKTGFVNESKQTLATTAENDQIGVTVICLKADYKRDIYNDTINLMSFGLSSYKSTILPTETTFKKNKDKFVLTESLYITEPIEGAVVEVNSEGELSVQDRSKAVIQTIPLEKYKIKVSKNSLLANEQDSKNKSMSIPFIVLSVGVGFALVATAIGKHIKRITR